MIGPRFSDITLLEPVISTDDNRIARFDPAYAALPASIRTSRPDCALILGSGWSERLPEVEIIAECSYDRIPGFGQGQVAGHGNRLSLLSAHGKLFLAFCGRRHWYECGNWDPVMLPVELARRLGVHTLFATNAAGAIRPNLAPGDLMLLRDHLNPSGLNPLQGPQHPVWSPQFPDLSALYDADLARALLHRARDRKLCLSEGVYAFTPGPCYETPAEVRALALLGADAVGMSTVPECVLAHAAGMRVLAVSCITNMAAGILKRPLSHAEVLTETRRSAPNMARLLDACMATI